MSAAVTSAVVRIITAGAPVHWLLGPIGSNVNQYSIAPRSTTGYHDGVQRQSSYPTIPLSQFRGQAAVPSAGTFEKMAESSGVPTAGGPVDNGGATFNCHYRFDRATIQELCTQLEPDLMSPIRHPIGIPPDVQVLSVLHFLASG
ncbi:hypothetical protein NDU88_002157 [Pleurodeles waltl]|uniref:Uncharacterized protein n=1 Tax=Pleurodeles waltl TaxID=8319 RepID=A0AAV7P7I5_PLEWA|nr:hypothetical protein NDU88_002157 [Pleurodeles waltl]